MTSASYFESVTCVNELSFDYCASLFESVTTVVSVQVGQDCLTTLRAWFFS